MKISELAKLLVELLAIGQNSEIYFVINGSGDKQVTLDIDLAGLKLFADGKDNLYLGLDYEEIKAKLEAI